MSELLSSLMNLSVLVFTVTSMASVGLAYSVLHILAPLRNVRAVLRALLANFVLVPLLALGIARLLALDAALELGLMLLATGAGAPFLIKLTDVADGNLAKSSTLLVLLVPATVIAMPILIPLALPEVAVSGGAIALQLFLTMILPLIAGLLVHEVATRWARRLQPIMARISSVTLVVLLATTIALHLPSMRALLGTGAIAALLILVGGAFYLGYLLGGPASDTRTVFALGTGQRNIAAATVVATQSVERPDTLSMVIVGSVIGMLVLFPLARVLRKQNAETMPPAGIAGASA